MPTWWFVPIVGVLAHLAAGRCQVMQGGSAKVASDLEFWSEILPQRSSEDLVCTHKVFRYNFDDVWLRLWVPTSKVIILSFVRLIVLCKSTS